MDYQQKETEKNWPIFSRCAVYKLVTLNANALLNANYFNEPLSLDSSPCSQTFVKKDDRVIEVFALASVPFLMPFLSSPQLAWHTALLCI